MGRNDKSIRGLPARTNIYGCLVGLLNLEHKQFVAEVVHTLRTQLIQAFTHFDYDTVRALVMACAPPLATSTAAIALHCMMHVACCVVLLGCVMLYCVQLRFFASLVNSCVIKPQALLTVLQQIFSAQLPSPPLHASTSDFMCFCGQKQSMKRN